MACRSSVLPSLPISQLVPRGRSSTGQLCSTYVLSRSTYDPFLTTLSDLAVLFLHVVTLRNGISPRPKIPIHEPSYPHSLRLLNHQQTASTTMNTGDELVIAMWAMTALSLALVVLRLYTRIVVVKFVGAEDYMYACTGVCQLNTALHCATGLSARASPLTISV